MANPHANPKQNSENLSRADPWSVDFGFETPKFCFKIPQIRDGEMTIKIKFVLVKGGGIGGREEIVQSRFFCGNATTINFESANLIVELFCCHCTGS